MIDGVHAGPVVRAVPTDTIDGGWDEAPSSGAVLRTPVSSRLALELVSVVQQRVEALAALRAAEERVRELVGREEGLRPVLAAEMDREGVTRVSVAGGHVVAVADRVRERDGVLEVVGRAGVRVVLRAADPHPLLLPSLEVLAGGRR